MGNNYDTIASHCSNNLLIPATNLAMEVDNACPANALVVILHLVEKFVPGSFVQPVVGGADDASASQPRRKGLREIVQDPIRAVVEGRAVDEGDVCRGARARINQ